MFRSLITILLFFGIPSLVLLRKIRSRKIDENLLSFLDYEIHGSNQLPNDKQITSFLGKNETKTFLYTSNIKDTPLSITLITCTSSVNWKLKYHINTTTTNKYTYESINTSIVSDIQTIHLFAKLGVYILELTPVLQSTYIHMYVSTEPNGTQALQNFQNQNVIKLIKRQQRKKLMVRWEPSLLDPHVTEYCLVLNLLKHYSTLCSAHGDRFSTITACIDNDTEDMSQWKINETNDKEKYPSITCVGSKTHLTLTNLQQNQMYYFDLFALNRQSNLTYLYGFTQMIFDKRTKHIRLKHDKSMFVNLKKYDGKAILKYKLKTLSSDSLKLYVTPCGGAINIDVSLKNKIVIAQTRIEGFGRLVIKEPKIGSRYYIRILSSNKEELRRTSGVEILASTKPSAVSILPNMPSELTVQEYISSRKCDSITVGWLASPSQQVVQYCLIVRGGHLREMETMRLPNQCELENRLKKSADFTVKYCRDVKLANEQVLIQTIKQLKPGRSYVVQVTVKKPKGKTLSYELLQINTKPTCVKTDSF